MIDIQFTKLAKARICLERRPVLEFESEVKLTRTIIARGTACRGQFLCIEALIPRGARADYGLLGILYEPHQSRQLVVVVRTCEMEGNPWQASLASALDDVRVGLPKAYSEAVMAGLVEDEPESCPGSLVLTEAAHGMVGSSPNFFRRLARAAKELLFTEHGMVTDIANDRLGALLL